MFRAFFRTLKQFFVDDAGELSCMRLMTFLVDVTVLALWVWGNFKAGQYVPLGYAEAGLLGAAHGAKAAQARFEYGSPMLPPLRDDGGCGV